MSRQYVNGHPIKLSSECNCDKDHPCPVCAGGLQECLNCGEYEAGLDQPCKAPKTNEQIAGMSDEELLHELIRAHSHGDAVHLDNVWTRVLDRMAFVMKLHQMMHEGFSAKDWEFRLFKRAVRKHVTFEGYQLIATDYNRDLTEFRRTGERKASEDPLSMARNQKLDHLGTMMGTPRLPDETDDAFRERLLDWHRKTFVVSTTVDKGIEFWKLLPEHAEALFGIVEKDRDYFNEWLPWKDEFQSVEHTKAAIIANLDKPGVRHYGIFYYNKQTGYIDRLVGGIGYEIIGSIPYLFYWLDKEEQGKGIMTRTVKVLTEMLLQKYEAVYIDCDKANTKSRAVAERAGFKLLIPHLESQALYGLGKMKGE